MKKVLLGFFLIALGCQADKNHNPFFDKLSGKWIRTNEEEGKNTYEYWQKDSLNYYSGKAFTLAEKDTVFLENMRILKLDEQWKLEVTAPQEDPLLFVINSRSDTGFTAENSKNEYPKKVEYSLKNEHLIAKISGGGPEITFDFEKMKP